MYKILLVLALSMLFVFFFQKKGSRAGKNFIKIEQEVQMSENLNLTAKIKTAKGDINIKLFPEVAPITVLNFTNLAVKGYYNGLKFHRVIADFMIQGGDPAGTGAGGPGYQFADEFKEGVVFNKPGLLAMANAGANTNGSQFFITHVETTWLNYKHTIFGEVISEDDQKVVNAIQQGDLMEEITIEGDVEKFLEENKDLLDQLNEALKQGFPQLF
jgi:peptidyl-prolyl cis-trans isomerase B (cyclophilin B)